MPTPRPAPPVAKSVDHSFEHLGRVFSDEYAWMHDKSHPDLLAYLEAENAYAQAMLAHTKPLQETLYAEMRGRIEKDDATVPLAMGGWLYYQREQAGKQYRLFCRRPAHDPDAPEQVLLDENVMAEGLAYCHVQLCLPSPDQRLLAYTVDTTGSWVYTLYVLDMESGHLLSGPVGDVAMSIAWAQDSRTLFYTRFDTSHRPYQVLRHTVDRATGDAAGDATGDALIYHETDDAFNVYLEQTRSGGYVLLTSASGTTSEVWALAADDPQGEFRLLAPRRHRVEYYVEHQAGAAGGPGRFLIWSNDDAENFRVLHAPADDWAAGAEPTAPARWRELIPHRSDALIESVSAFRDFVVIHERSDGLPQFRISAADGVSDVRHVAFPEPVYTASLTDRRDAFSVLNNPDYATDRLRLFYSSPVTPRTTVEYGMATGTWAVLKQQQIPSGYDPALYECARTHATTPDGAQVPISLVYRKGIARDGSNPLLLYGYGSYGFSMEAGFRTELVSLLDRGVVFAIGHIRGGSELGRAWYEQGRLLHKRNTFTDFVACAEHLIAAGYTRPDRLAIRGRSAGGLLVTAVTNLRPDLFKAVVAEVPFTNVIAAMRDPTLPLTVIEWEQWGNPDIPEQFEYMLSYSPYENIEARSYPAIFAKAGLHDLQVPVWDPAKWVARLRARKAGDTPLLLVTIMQAGHHGASGRYDALREEAEVYAFLLDALGVSV